MGIIKKRINSAFTAITERLMDAGYVTYCDYCAENGSVPVDKLVYMAHFRDVLKEVRA